MRLAEFRSTKLYDLLAGLPLMLWFGYGAMKLRPGLMADAQAAMAQPGDLLADLRFLSLLLAALFNLMIVVMVILRDGPVRRAEGLLPRAAAVAGTFLGVGIIHLPPVTLSPGWQAAATALLALGGLGSVAALTQLGRAFSILPEARRLVTDGPYAWARHPLYAAEIVTLAGTAMLFHQPWAALLAVAVVALLFSRTHFEERVLVATYPEYAAYRARTARFIPGIW